MLLNGKETNKIDFVEFDLDNGLHVILYQDRASPNVVVGVKYHVGSKNEEPDRTGFAHFFEHLLFHGSENIPQGEFENIVTDAGGYTNAYTSYDVTYYYQLLPAHEYKLGLWLESERMLHPIITEEGINREREIVKEEKRLRYDNKALGNSYNDIMSSMFDQQTYGHSMIGSMEHLDAASVKDFSSFFKKYYVPNNACLVVAGNIDYDDCKKWIEYYFNDIPGGKKINRPSDFGTPSGREKIIEKATSGIDHTSFAISYYCMPETDRDAKVLEVISAILSKDGDNSLLKRNIEERDSTVKSISSLAELWEGVGLMRIMVKLNTVGGEKDVIRMIDLELEKLGSVPVRQTDLTRILNSYEFNYTDLFYDNEQVADFLTNYYHIKGDAQGFNNIIKEYLSITTDDIMRVSRKYLYPENRVIIIYYPES